MRCGCSGAPRLTADGRLVLERFDFSSCDRPPQPANEALTGDFYLVAKSTFEGPRMYVPFRDGMLVLDHAHWRHERYVGNSPSATELVRGESDGMHRYRKQRGLAQWFSMHLHIRGAGPGA